MNNNTNLDELLAKLRGTRSRINNKETYELADTVYKLLEALTENIKELRKAILSNDKKP